MKPFLVNEHEEKINKTSVIAYLVEVIIPIIPYIYLAAGIIINAFIGDKLKSHLVIFTDFEMVINSKLFTAAKLEMLTTITAVIIGFYITVMAVFGTSYSPSIIEISKVDLSQKFMRYSSQSLIYAFAFLLTSVIFDIINIELKITIMIFLMTAMFAHCMRFTIIVMLMYKRNIELAENNEKENNKKHSEILNRLDRINNNIMNENLKSQTEILEEFKSSLKKQEQEAPEIPRKKKQNKET